MQFISLPMRFADAFFFLEAYCVDVWASLAN